MSYTGENTKKLLQITMSYYIFNDKDEFFDVYINDVIFTAVILGISYNRYGYNFNIVFDVNNQRTKCFFAKF